MYSYVKTRRRHGASEIFLFHLRQNCHSTKIQANPPPLSTKSSEDVVDRSRCLASIKGNTEWHLFLHQGNPIASSLRVIKAQYTIPILRNRNDVQNHGENYQHLAADDHPRYGIICSILHCWILHNTTFYHAQISAT